MAPHTTNPDRTTETTGLSQTMVRLLVALMVLLIVAILLVGALLVFRQRRKARKALALPIRESQRYSTASAHSYHRRVSARPSQSIHVFREKQQFFEDSSSDSLPSPTAALPEIRITFPEEIDAAGRRQSGHVVVVHVGDKSLGFEPVSEDLPAYQLNEGGRFQSIDLERVGGLTEKEARLPLGWN